MNNLFKELEKIKFPLKSRRNVNDKKYEYYIFHYNHSRFHQPGLSYCNKKFPIVYKMLMELIKKEDKDFNFTSIIINKNNVCKKHKDKGNVGLSYICGLGDYEKGELFINNKGYNIKNKFLKFDGQNEHYSTEYSGTRYSIVYYTLSSVKNHLEKNSSPIIKINNLTLHVRQFTTDVKVVDDVIKGNCYKRYKIKYDKTQNWLDLGGNIGTFTCLISKNVNKVFVFEPEPDNYELLVKNINENKLENVKHYRYGITENGLDAKLYLCNTNYNKYQHSLIKGHKKKSINIKCKKFKDIIKENPDINCIKIDIEGSEKDILENNDFSKIKILIFEWDFNDDNRIERLRKCLINLRNQGFTIRGETNQVKTKEIWTSYPRARLIYCFRE